MNGVLYSLESNDLVTSRVIAFDELPDGVELIPGVAYQYFKVAREKFNIRGKRFIFLLNGKVFYIGRTVLRETRKDGKIAVRHDFKIYELGEEHGISNIVSRQDGDDHQ